MTARARARFFQTSPPPQAGGGGSSGSANLALFYTDLSDGPKTGGLNNNGVWVTLFGRGFGSVRGSGSVTLGGGAVADYFSWSDTKIVVQLGAAVATGNFTVITNGGQSTTGRVIKPNGTSNDFTVRSGNIKFIAASGTNGTGTVANPYVQAINRIRDNFASGDVWYFRSGTYNQQLVVNGWGNNVLNVGGPQSGTANAHTTFSAYPGETVTLDIGNPGAIYLRDNNETVCNYVTFANFALRGYQGFSGGAQTSANAEVSNSGGQFAYLVNCDIQGRHPGDAATGIVTFGGNNGMALGNLLHDTGGPGNSEVPSYANQNHGFYIQVGTDNMVVAFNTLRDLNMGATIQVHTDSFFEYTNVRILYNHFVNTSPSTANMRGIVVGHMYGSSTGCIVGNVFDNVGNTNGFPPIIIYGGQWDIDNNTVMPRVGAGSCMLLSNQVSTETYRNNGANYAPPQVRVRNNIFFGTESYIAFGGAGTPAGVFTTAQLTAANNLYTGAGAGPSYDTTKVQAAAGMVNVAAQDYTLSSTSAARNAGTLTSLNTNALIDRFGVPRPQESVIDIGAHEYVSAAISKTQQSANLVQPWSPDDAWPAPGYVTLTGVQTSSLLITFGAWWDDVHGPAGTQSLPSSSNGGTLSAGINPTLPNGPSGYPTHCQIAHFLSPAAGTHNITPQAVGANGDGYFLAAEFSGPSGTWSLVTTGSNVSESATAGAVDGVTVTTSGSAQVGDLVIAGVLTDGDPTAIGVGAAPGYTEMLSTSTTTNNIGAGLGWKIATSSGVQSAAWTWADNDQKIGAAVIAVYRRS